MYSLHEPKNDTNDMQLFIWKDLRRNLASVLGHRVTVSKKGITESSLMKGEQDLDKGKTDGTWESVGWWEEIFAKDLWDMMGAGQTD